ncbi:CTP synthase (glutamine hydrolyzing) [Candidatus Gracilibacteria bacterium]|nr:CTP synthase (glutamine hydrolyzing) [Candidatus Gracilibacteria bacterium]
MRKKYIIVTGGVISGIGKGVTTAAIGFFMAEKYSVCPIKLDGYLNIDPGTMNPLEHGEVFVLADGGEVDMDFGHYERFLGIECSSLQSISMGKIYAGVLEKERRGDFLGKTVQMIPHVTDHIVERIEEVFSQSDAEICMIEVGGTVGDIEVELYLEAIRQMKRKKRQEDFLHIHLTYVPIPGGVGEQKTKPTQQSINLLQSRGLFPDIIIARGRKKLTKETREKIALFSNLRQEKIFSIPDVESIYTIPTILHKQKLDTLLHGKLNIKLYESGRLKLWEMMIGQEKKMQLKIGIIGKYTALEDSYSSVLAALEHAGYYTGTQLEIIYIDARKTQGIQVLKSCDACIIPGGFGDTGIEHMIEAVRFLRVNKIPTLGICLGLQIMIIEYARNILNIPKANSLEFNKTCAPHDVITLLDSQKNIMQLGGTMRLGKQISVVRNSEILACYEKLGRVESKKFLSEKFRHRYEVHPDFAKKLEGSSLKIVGTSKKEGIVQFIEMDTSEHPYYIGTQSHPELTTKLENPAPLFVGLLEATIRKKNNPL